MNVLTQIRTNSVHPGLTYRVNNFNGTYHLERVLKVVTTFVHEANPNKATDMQVSIYTSRITPFGEVAQVHTNKGWKKRTKKLPKDIRWYYRKLIFTQIPNYN